MNCDREHFLSVVLADDIFVEDFTNLLWRRHSVVRIHHRGSTLLAEDITEQLAMSVLRMVHSSVQNNTLSACEFNSPQYQIPAPDFLFREIRIPFLPPRCCIHV